MTRPRACLALLAFLAASAAAAQGIYRWTDADGKVHFGSNPPPGAKANEVRSRVNAYSAPAETQPAAKAAAPVVMYATSWCPYCAKARAYFAKNGIAYVEHDIEKSATVNAEFKRLGGRGVPLILVGTEKISGFSELAFESMLARAAR
jgi:glutaredoxin